MRVSLPIQRNFRFRQDADFRFVYTLKNPDGSLINVTGWDVRMQMRASDYGKNGSFPAKTGLLSITSAVALPDGEDPRWYRWDGAQIVKRPLAEIDPRATEIGSIKAKIEGSLELTPSYKDILKRLLALTENVAR